MTFSQKTLNSSTKALMDFEEMRKKGAGPCFSAEQKAKEEKAYNDAIKLKMIMMAQGDLFDDVPCTKTGKGKGGTHDSIISVQFPINTIYNTSEKRRKFIKKLNVIPIKKQHKTANYYKYRIKEALPNSRKFTKKINDVSVIFERLV